MTIARATLFPALVAAGLMAALGAVPQSRAQDFQPYPSPRITVEQWQAYLAQVRASFDSTAEIFRDKHLVVFSDRASRTFYIFTSKDHPAHPAWITRQMVEQDGQVNVRQIGYFAGDQPAFDQLFREYLQMNEQLRQDAERRNR